MSAQVTTRKRMVVAEQIRRASPSAAVCVCEPDPTRAIPRRMRNWNEFEFESRMAQEPQDARECHARTAHSLAFGSSKTLQLPTDSRKVGRDHEDARHFVILAAFLKPSIRHCRWKVRRDRSQFHKVQMRPVSMHFLQVRITSISEFLARSFFAR